MNTNFNLEQNLKGRDIFTRVIPTVNTLNNLFKKLDENDWDIRLLKNWEKPIYKAYNLDEVKISLKLKNKEERIQLIKNHLLNQDSNKLGAHPICIYLISYYIERGYPKNLLAFEEFVLNNGISKKKLSAQAIWSVGVADGKYLGLFDEELTIVDKLFFEKWTNSKVSKNNPSLEKKEEVKIKQIKTHPLAEEKEKKGSEHLNYFLDLPVEDRVFMGPNSYSWSSYVLEEQIEQLHLLERRFYRDELLAFCSNKNNSDLLVLLAVLSWGGMNREHGKKLLNNPVTIVDIVNKLRSGYFSSRKQAFDFIQHQRKLDLLPGLGIGYFTKLICFLAPELNGYIMDQWVAKSINLLSDRKMVHIDKSSWVTDLNSSDVYEDFCSEIDNIASVLKINGYKAEEKLFSIGGRTKGIWRKYVIDYYTI